jgi:T1SS-143 domain-containing protein
MATDNTTNQTDTANNASTVHESDVEQVHLTQAGTPVQVQVPQGQNVVRVQVTPGETVELPFPTDGSLVARLADGNLAVKVGDVTVILLGYEEAIGQGEVNIVGNNGVAVDVAAVIAATDPNLDIQTAAGPAAGDQGAGVDNNGGLFTPFDPNAGIGGLNAIGGLDPTALNYNLIQREFVEIIEADEEDTTPTVVNITQAPPVNEDDFHHDQFDDRNPEIDTARAAFNIGGDVPSGGYDILSRLSDIDFPNGECASFGNYKDGNDPFDRKDHEDGSQTGFLPDDSNGPVPGGIDMDREPLSATAVVEANFFADLPGKLVLDSNGDGTGTVPLIEQLEGMNLTSHGHELAYMLLPEVPESAPGAGDGRGQMVIAYYLEDACNCYGGEQSFYEGNGEGGKVPVIVFSIGVDDDVVNAGETNPAGNAEFGITFTIYGVVDHPEKGGGTEEGNGVEDILKIEVPFFLDDQDSPPVPSDFPQPLVFEDIDDMPFLGEVCYVSVPCLGDIPIAIHKADLTIGHDESAGVQHTDYDSNGYWPGGQQETDDTGSPWPAMTADWKLDGIGHGYASGEDVDISYQQGILSKLDSQYLHGGNFCADVLGSAKTYLSVSFGADGKAKGNDQAGNTLFDQDNDAGEGTDNSQKTYDSDGNLIGNDDGGTDKRAFELFMNKQGEGNPTTNSADTNWFITVMINGEPVQVRVTAYQLDANTIIGMASPPEGQEEAFAAAVNGEEGPNHCLTGTGNDIPVFMLTLDPNSGQLTFVQYHQINNPQGGDVSHNWQDWPNDSANDPIQLLDSNGKPLVYFQATDFDGDTVTAQLQVSVIDDAPCAVDDKAVLDEENAGIDGELNKVTGNLVLGISNDGVNNDNGGDKLSVDHDHTIPALKYGNSIITFDFAANTFNVTGSDAKNVQFNGHVVEFDTPHGHFKVVVDANNPDPVSPGDQPTESWELGYYEYTSNPGNNSDKDQYGLKPTANGTEDPVGANDAQKIANILSKYNGIQITNNFDNNNTDANDWGLKTITADGKHYTGIGVKQGIDGGETDMNGNGNVAEEVITIRFPNDVDSAKITVGALFDGQLYDSGNAEALKWEAWDGNTKVGEGVIYGGKSGLVDFFINLDDDFDKVTLKPLDNGAGNNGNNSDFLLVGVKTCDELCITEQLQYKLQDVDGDYDTAKLTIDVLDGEPKITSCEYDLSVVVDEDGLPTGNDNNVWFQDGDGADNVGGDNGPGDADGSEATAAGHIAYNVYADGLGGVFLSSSSALTTLDGKSVTWAWDPTNGRLVGYATPDTDRIVVEVVLSNVTATGSDFQVILHEAVKHPSNSYEDNLYLDIKVTVTDKDCDIDTANIQVKIDDDVPEICGVSYTASILGAGVVDEDALDNGIEGGPADIGVFGKSVSGQVHVAPGADQPVVFSFAETNGTPVKVLGLALPPEFTLTDVNGNPVTLLVDNAGTPATLTGMAAGEAVFTITLDKATGEFTFTLLKPVEHPSDGNPFGSGSLEDSLLSLGITVKVTDADGDYDTTDLAIKINDDTPQLDEQTNVTVDEDGLPGGIAGGTDDVPGESKIAMGDLGGGIGADGLGSIQLQLDGGSPKLSSTGQTLSWTQVGNVLIGHTGDVNDPAMKLTVNADGTYQVEILKALKHADGNNENNLDVKFKISMTDADGDKVTGKLKVTVDDDTPVASDDFRFMKESDASISGNVITGLNGIDPAAEADASGADTPGRITSVKSISAAGSDQAVDNDGTIGDGDSTVVQGLYGKLTISEDGSYSYQLDPEFEVEAPTVPAVTVGRDGTGGQASDWVAQGLTISAKTFDGSAGTVQFDSNGIGVSGTKPGLQVPGQIGYDPNSETSETLVMEFGCPIVSATIKVSNLFNDENDGEQGTWKAYDANGILIGQGLFGPGPDAPGYIHVDFNGSNNIGSFTIDTGDTNGANIAKIEFGATEYGPGENAGDPGNDASDYYIREVEYLPAVVQEQFEYALTDADNDTDKAVLTINVCDNVPSRQNHEPGISSQSGAVDEDYLTIGTNSVAGNQDLPAPSPEDDGGNASATGTYTVDFHGEGGTIAFEPLLDGADTGVDTLDGANIVWDRVSDTELHGHRAGDTNDVYFTMTLDNTSGSGNWTFNLLQAIHHDENSNEDAADPVLNVSIVATDGFGGDKGSTTVQIAIDDDMPIVENDAVTVTEGTTTGGKANVLFILDVTGSMNTVDPGNSSSRLVLAKAAIIAAAQKYFDAVGGDNANIKFQLATFGATGVVHSETWMDFATFASEVATATTISNTNYDRGLLTGMDAFNKPGAIADATNVSFFVSDGEPNQGTGADGFDEDGPSSSTGSSSDDGIGANEEGAWQDFLEANDILSYAIGIGPNATTGNALAELAPIAYDGRPGGALTDNDLVLSSADVADLETVLGDIGGIGKSGNLLENDAPGADNWADQAIVKVLFGLSAYLPDENGVIVVQTPAGTLTVYGKDYDGHVAGDYVFEAGEVEADQQVGFTYIAEDRDGDQVEGAFAVTVLKTRACRRSPRTMGSTMARATGSPSSRSTCRVLIRMVRSPVTS